MKKLFTCIAAITVSICVFAQAPQKMSYQAVVRNSSGVLVANQSIGMRVSILQGSPTGTLLWTETSTPNPQTNDNGLVSIEIGASNPISIDWSSGGPYFLQTETDPTGGTSYTIIGTSQLLSVPYALHAKTAASYSETDPVFSGWDKSTGISIPNAQISNWSGATSAFLTGITSGQVTTALGFTPYNSTNPSGYTSSTGTVTSVAMSTPVGLTIAGTPITTSGTLALALTTGYAIPTTNQLFPGFGTTADKAANGNHTHDYSGVYAALAHDHNGTYEPVVAVGTTSQYMRGDKSWQTLNTNAVVEGSNLYYTDARARAAISLTTTGNSGAASYISGVINIPDYTLSGLGGQSALNGTGLVRMTGTTVSYDNSTYLITETDPNAVLSTGNQTVAGNKTFTGTTTVPTPVNSTDATTKAYVDALLARIEALENLHYGFTDTRDGNRYNGVKIGNQIWMVGNLKYLPVVHNNAEFQTQGNSSLLGYGVYEYNGSDVATAKSQANYTTYGVLYNWYAVNSANVCPTGWHLPTDAEWTTLITYLGSEMVAGGKLKETGTTHWTSPSFGATNETGFTALPGGIREYDGQFIVIGSDGYWWSASEGDAADAWGRSLNSGNIYVFSFSTNKKYGFSVRCLMD